MVRLRAWAAIALATTVVVGACSDQEDATRERSPEGGSALTGPSNWHEVCVSARYSQDFTVGVAVASNVSNGPVTLLEAALTHPDGIALVGTDVVRPGNVMDTFGVWNGYPPRQLKDAPVERRAWQAREPIENSRVRPDERINFVLHLTGVGRAGPLQVTYRTGEESEETWTSNVRYSIRKVC